MLAGNVLLGRYVTGVVSDVNYFIDDPAKVCVFCIYITGCLLLVE